MEPRLKLWIERDGRLALSDYRVRLLALVQETGSLAQAAAEMRLSYRRAWGKIKEMERNLGVQLVTSEAGGAGGGHSRLTAEGARLIRRYEAFAARMHEILKREYATEFEDPPLALISPSVDGAADLGDGQDTTSVAPFPEGKGARG